MSGLFSISVSEARGLVAASTTIDKLTVVMGCASTAVGLSPFYLSASSAIAGEGYGDAVDTLCQIIEQVQPAGTPSVKVPAALYTTAGSTAGSYGTINVTGVTGTSAVTTDAAVHPYITSEAWLKVVVGGTIATGPITIAYSLDGGRNYVTGIALGTANTYTIPHTNIKFNFGTGTLVTGDVAKVRTKAPAPNGSDITAAFTALAASSVDCGIVVCEWDMTAALAANVSTGLSAMRAAGKQCLCLFRTRLPDAETSETDAAWNTAVAADFLAFQDSSMAGVATYGLLTDASTGRQYLRSDLAQYAADVARVDIQNIPNCPADRREANFTLVNASGTTVGHDEGVRGSSTGLSNNDLGNRFVCSMRLADQARREDVYSTVPWVMYAPDERIRTVPARRVANALTRVAVSAGNTALGGIVRFMAASGTIPAQLTESSRLALQGVIYNALASRFRGVIQNASDASVDTGLVQVASNIVVAAGNLVTVAVTLAPRMFGYIQTINVVLSVQE